MDAAELGKVIVGDEGNGVWGWRACAAGIRDVEGGLFGGDLCKGIVFFFAIYAVEG